LRAVALRSKQQVTRKASVFSIATLSLVALGWTGLPSHLRGFKYGWPGHLDPANQPDGYCRLRASGLPKTRFFFLLHILSLLYLSVFIYYHLLPFIFNHIVIVLRLNVIIGISTSILYKPFPKSLFPPRFSAYHVHFNKHKLDSSDSKRCIALTCFNSSFEVKSKAIPVPDRGGP
jgi:hypothetical protein